MEMKNFIFSLFCCLILHMLEGICRAQLVVDIVTSSYPGNVLKVPVYSGSGSIHVELRKPQTSQVTIACRLTSTDVGATNVTFQNVNIPARTLRVSVNFDIISAGHVNEVQCGTQFPTSSSLGQTGYIQVTKRPTVSLCSNVVVVPMSNATVRAVEVLLSENIVHDPVTINCSVISPLRAGSVPMRLKFDAELVPLCTNTCKVNVTYVVESVGDPVVVGCWASSNTAPDRNPQYTKNTSRGETAVFTYQVPRATFVPASITSLGRTTVVRTLSYLVLESPATDVVGFHCSFRNDSHARTCSGNLPRTSSFDLNSVTVELITTNMTFETASRAHGKPATANILATKVGDYYKPLSVQVNGSSNERDQRLLDVTCCRKNVDPKYFVLSTTLSIWIDAHPIVQFDWDNVTGETQATPFSQFDALCLCDLKVSLCDVGCCCDVDCSSVEKQTFSCIPGYFGGSTHTAIFEYGCQETWSNGDNYLAILCVVTDNNPFLGLLYDTPPASAGDSVQFDSLQADAPKYEYRENETRSLVENDVIGAGYRDGVIIKTDSAVLTLPQVIGASACARYAPVVFLRDTVTWCSSEFSESMCSEKSSWSALDYLVPSISRSCLTSPQVLNLNSRVNSSSVPTHIQYFCVKDATTYTTELGKPWGGSTESESLNADQRTGNKFSDPRCVFDDGVSKPPAPEFNASSRKCSNVVLKVDYDIFWKGGKIIQLRARLTLGDVSPPADNVIIAQRFSVKFTYLNEVDPMKLPFIQPVYEQRSGNPGYITGKKVIAKVYREQSSSSINQTSLGQLGLWSPSLNGLCPEARTTDVLFGVNSLSGCLFRLSLKDFTNCSLLRESVSKHQANLVKATHIARRGSVSLNETKDWLVLLSDTGVEASNASSNETSNTSYNQSRGSCDDIPASLHYEILTRETGIYFGTPQIEVVGARVRYSMNSWTFRCTSGNCNICNTTSTNISGNNDTINCRNAFQSFPVTSSVNFITLSNKDSARVKRSQAVSDVCYQDACVEEVFYPLMTSYDGETREVAIAYGLMLVAFVLLITTISTSLLQNLKTLLLG